MRCAWCIKLRAPRPDLGYPVVTAVKNHRSVTISYASESVVDVRPGRFPAAIEATLYFTLSEALTNVAKYAPDATVLVSVASAEGWVFGLVVDDGPGGADTRAGGGLAGIVDRARVLSGWASVDSTPEGPRVAVHLPVDVELVA